MVAFLVARTAVSRTNNAEKIVVATEQRPNWSGWKTYGRAANAQRPSGACAS